MAEAEIPASADTTALVRLSGTYLPLCVVVVVVGGEWRIESK